MCDERLSDDASALLARVARLENSDSETRSSKLTETVSSVQPEDDTPQPKDDIPQPEDDTPADAHTADVPDSEPQIMDSGLELPDSTAGSDFWSDVLDMLKSNPPVHALLNDDTKVHVKHEENVLTIRAGDVFTAGSIEKKEFFEPLKSAVGKVLGHKVVVRVETSIGKF
jgi:hypothetical protein